MTRSGVLTGQETWVENPARLDANQDLLKSSQFNQE